MRAQLVGCTGPVSGKRYAFEDIARVGRDGSNEISISVPSLARLHATISYSGGTFWLEDAGSPAGTFLNAKKIAKERLYHLDVLGFGPEVELVFLARAPVETGPREGLLGARLLALEGPEAGSVREIPKGTFTVGRSNVCNLVIESAAVSKTHARFERTNSYLTVTDLGSANGTFVNGVRITSVPLASGDRVLFAAAREFRVELEIGALSSSDSSIDLRSGVREPAGAAQSQIMEIATNWKSKYDFTPGAEAAPGADDAKKATPAARPPAPPAPAKPAAPPAPVKSAAPPAPAEPAAPPAAAKPTAPPVAPEAPGPAAVVLTGSMGTFTFTLGRHVVGRGEGCAIMLQSTKASRQHAAVEVTPGGVIVTDLGSANGTFVDGQRLTAPHRLKGGETVTFGDVAFAASLQGS